VFGPFWTIYSPTIAKDFWKSDYLYVPMVSCTIPQRMEGYICEYGGTLFIKNHQVYAGAMAGQNRKVNAAMT
jgi:hypothetical protein